MPILSPIRRLVRNRVWFLVIPIVMTVGDAARQIPGVSLLPESVFPVAMWSDAMLSEAMAGGGMGADSDLDGLPDEIEAIFMTRPFLGDSDGDGFSDGIEWVQRADPLDPSSVPHLQVALRSYVYQAGSTDMRVFTAMWPGNLSLVEQFLVYLGSPHLSGPEGNATLGLMDVTQFIPQLLGQVTSQASQGMILLSFSFDLDQALLNQYSPLSVGIGARLAGTPVVERMTCLSEGGTSMVMFPEPSVKPGSGPANYWFVPLDPAGGGSAGMFGAGGGAGDPEYCETQLDPGVPTGAGGIVHQIQAAACTPQGFLYCVATDCSALAGQNITLIDYGFLQTKAKQ